MPIKSRSIILPNRRIKTSKYRILGLDCSSATIGWGLISMNQEPILVAHGHIKPLKSNHNIFVRIQDAYEAVSELCLKFDPTHIVIEDILLHMKGKSSAKTITMLAVFNRVVGMACYSYTGIIPKLFSVASIRKIIKDKIGGEFKKEDIPDIIRKYLEFGFSNIINRNNKVSKETYDEADGIIAAWAYSLAIKRKDEKINDIKKVIK